MPDQPRAGEIRDDSDGTVHKTVVDSPCPCVCHKGWGSHVSACYCQAQTPLFDVDDEDEWDYPGGYSRSDLLFGGNW